MTGEMRLFTLITTEAGGFITPPTAPPLVRLGLLQPPPGLFEDERCVPAFNNMTQQDPLN